MTTWIIYALLSAFFAALVAIFGKIGLKGIDTTFATTLRSIIMAAFLVMTSLALGKIDFHTPLGGKALTFIILSGIAGALSWLFYWRSSLNPPWFFDGGERASRVPSSAEPTPQPKNQPCCPPPEAEGLVYFSALKNGPASGVAALDRLSVVFVLALALLFLGEHFTWKSSLGAFLIAAGAILMVIQ